jgi:hypothetical protein
VHAAINNLKSQGSVSVLRAGIFSQRVRGHLKTALGACPIFRRLHQRTTHPLMTKVRANEPSFDEANRARRVAAIRVGTKAGFDKAGQRAVQVKRNQQNRWKGGRRSAENSVYVSKMFVKRRLRPKRSPQLRQFVAVRILCGADSRLH